ncbi:hypothetical protein J2741_000308 [Methanolinea mesophila]|uniref:PepSY domain-containing protein n=1 Tax=Methanolinea mesophila TaxID=547055 RepID=UPI001AE6BE56|nr:PepSY domain-containing protein [Methanolinea mesophila]MBP1927761.1 hypothetical protein [Methanolinea mesophila]
MKMNKIAMKIFIVFILSLTLTAGYAQALPGIYNFGAQISTTSPTFSIVDLRSHDSFLIFGKYFFDFSKPKVVLPSEMISKDEAIVIAKNLWPDAIWTGKPNALLFMGVWTVTLNGYTKDWEGDCPDGYYCIVTDAGGKVKIDAITGEVISVNAVK